ncbi:nucleotide binding protein [[Candida] boidinii]|nr:nucleotide binding protein [[Candida] boidinii]
MVDLYQHHDIKNIATSYIYMGSLPFEATELDILIIFSQYGVPTDLKISGYDADKIRYNPRNDPINNGTFNSVRNRNEEAQVEIDKGNDNDQTKDEEEDEFEDPMAKFLENKETTVNKKRTIDDLKSCKSNRNTGSKSYRRFIDITTIIIIIIINIQALEMINKQRRVTVKARIDISLQ